MTSKIAHNEQEDVARFGFWLYLLSDVMIFAALFATFMVLRHNTVDGPSAPEIINPSIVLFQTIALLTSSFTVAVAVLAAKAGRLKEMKRFLWLTLAFGAFFLGLELYEFNTLIHEGYSWKVSAFLSSFFALVGTHGLHITVGLIWLTVWLIYFRKRGLDQHMTRKLGLFALFWHFLDIVWIWVFTIVYMFGVAL
jgi:cytochrome o ubiquinol oxidase subunit 3